MGYLVQGQSVIICESVVITVLDIIQKLNKVFTFVIFLMWAALSNSRTNFQREKPALHYITSSLCASSVRFSKLTKSIFSLLEAKATCTSGSSSVFASLFLQPYFNSDSISMKPPDQKTSFNEPENLPQLSWRYCPCILLRRLLCSRANSTDSIVSSIKTAHYLNVLTSASIACAVNTCKLLRASQSLWVSIYHTLSKHSYELGPPIFVYNSFSQTVASINFMFVLEP